MFLYKDQDKIKEFIEDLLMQRESEDLEFKHASGGFPGSFWDTYSSFANTEGGTILFGVVEKILQRWTERVQEQVVAEDVHDAGGCRKGRQWR